MASVNIEDLFDDNRLPNGMALLPLLLYFPLGVVLAVIRFFIGFHAFLVACILPKMSTLRSVVLRSMCSVLGIIVTQEGMENRDSKVKVMVANYTTTFDHLAVDLIMPSILPCVWDLPPALMWLLGYTDLGAKQGRERLIQNAKKHTRDSSVPILVFPEGASTNSRVGLLKFSVWPFSLDQPVQPVVITVIRPSFTRISPSVLGGRWWIDVFWFLFVPYTTFRIRVLPVMAREEQSVSEFTKQVQTVLATGMNVAATNHTSADKVEYAKRKLFVQPQSASRSSSVTPTPSTSSGITGNSGLELMIRQVQEVLPHVPVDAIKQDLARTKDVDTTLTNILEGHVQYTVQEGVPSSPTPPSPLTPTNHIAQPQVANTAAKSFARSSSGRQMSLEERKKALIENARRKYMIKKGMI